MCIWALEGGAELIVLGTVASRIWVELKATVSSLGGDETLPLCTQGAGGLDTFTTVLPGIPRHYLGKE